MVIMSNGNTQLHTATGDKHERIDDRIARAVEERFQAREKTYDKRLRGRVKLETEQYVNRKGWNWFKRLMTAEAIFVIVVITPVGFFYSNVQKTLQRQERAIQDTEAKLISLSFRIDSIRNGLGQIDGYRDQFMNELSSYQAGFIRTLERTADMQGTANTALLSASSALGEVRGFQTRVASLTDSLGMNAHRVDSLGRNVSILSGQVGEIDQSLEDGLAVGVIYDASTHAPCDVQSTPLRLMLRGISESGAALVEVQHREHGGMLRSGPLGTGESLTVDTDRGAFRVTLLQASQTGPAGPLARFRIQRVR